MVGDGAQLTVVSLQDWADDAVHTRPSTRRVGRDATLKHVAVSFGGDLVRHDTTVEYAGPGGSVELLGLYFADEGQHIEHRLFVDHTAPRTRSHVVYKGALQGEGAHAVWIGNVLIRKVAEGINTYEENRNLVLTDGCQADSVPNLEIETGEIEGAGHASATGRFDDNQLFYLRSRGIDEVEARRLVVHGFFNDLIRKIGVPELEEQLLATVEAELRQDRRAAGAADGVRARLRGRRGARGRGPRGQSRRPDGRRSPGTRTSSSPSRTSARHATVPLSEGEVVDCTVECWLHGSTFDLRTGKPTGPAGDRAGRHLPRRGPRRGRVRRHHPDAQRRHPELGEAPA